MIFRTIWISSMHFAPTKLTNTQHTDVVIYNIGRNYSFNPVLSCNREYCNNGHIFLQRNLVYLQHNPLYPCIALVHHTATVQRPCSRPGFCSINEDIKTSFLCEHGIILKLNPVEAETTGSNESDSFLPVAKRG